VPGHHEDASFAAPDPVPSPPVFTRSWLIGTADRALKSFASSLVLLLGGGTIGLNILHVDWQQALGTAAGAAVLAVLFSVASAPIGEPGTTSLLPGGR
jgi:Putative lactococcus lactis phage r1t holin